MRYSEPGQPGSQKTEVAETAEERLRRENEELRQQLLELRGGHDSAQSGVPTKVWHPSAITIWAIVLGVAVLIVGAFFAGYVPLQRREQQVRSEVYEQEKALPRVEVVQVGRSSHSSELALPGNVQAITEAPILARASGYIEKRMVDIGDHVRTGQPLAEIDAPELEDQVRQAKANLQQTQAALEQALANSEQGKSDLEFARVTSERWSRLFKRGVVSQQENDQYRTQYQSRIASVQALDKAVAAQRSNIAAAEANLSRLIEMQGYRMVKAPFDGVVTLRNVDVGALVNAGSTLLFRIAQTRTVRIYLNVPQANASFIRAGQPAKLRVSNLPGRTFNGVVARMANALDPTSRTMLVEVHVPNPDGALLPGMYADVDLSSARANPPLLIPSNALIIRGNYTHVAVVRPDHTIHLQQVEAGRDYGDRLEITDGLREGDTIVPNPGDTMQEGLEISPVQAEGKAPLQAAPKTAAK